MADSVSVFDIFKVGIGPSSSHTVGPMRAARIFVTDLAQSPVWPEVTRVRAELFGSLGATGHGHGSEAAVLLGLEGEDPATVDTDQTPARAASIANDGRITLDDSRFITTVGGERHEQHIPDEETYHRILEERFGIRL